MAYSEEIKRIIAANIAFYRKKSRMTQLELAEKLNYSDKAVSKWESGASIPDVAVLASLSSLFGITVDDLISGDVSARDYQKAVNADASDIANKPSNKKMTHTQRIITLLSVALVWLIATSCFVFLTINGVSASLWLLFVWAFPVSSVVLIVLNSIWGNKRKNYFYISVFIWTFLAAIYLTLLQRNQWLLFIVGIPSEVIVIIWAGMKPKTGEKKT